MPLLFYSRSHSSSSSSSSSSISISAHYGQRRLQHIASSDQLHKCTHKSREYKVVCKRALLLLHSEVNDSHSASTEACCNPVLSVVPGHLKDVSFALVALDKGAISDAPDVQVPSKAATSQVVTTAAA
jgi:hypothetical protein